MNSVRHCWIQILSDVVSCVWTLCFMHNAHSTLHTKDGVIQGCFAFSLPSFSLVRHTATLGHTNISKQATRLHNLYSTGPLFMTLENRIGWNQVNVPLGP